MEHISHHNDRAVYGVGLRLVACWDWGFLSCRGHGCLSLVSAVLSGRRLCVGLIPVQRSPTSCGMSECDREASIMRSP